MNDDVIPINALNKTIHNWWFVVLMVIIGAFIGWGIHAFRPALYEARASFSISIDYVHTGKISDIEQDQVLGIVGDIISSPEVLDQVFSQAQNEGIVMDDNTFKQVSFMERQFYIWTLRIHDEDPKTAVRLVQIWVSAAQDALDNATKHAIIADILQQQVKALINCSEIVVYEPAPAHCNLESLAEIQDQVREIGGQITIERIASKGLLSGVSYVLSEKPVMPTKPVAYGLNQFMLVGSIFGFLLSWLGLSIDLPDRILRILK